MGTQFEKLARAYMKSIIKEDVDFPEDPEMNDAEEAPVKCVCFKTSDQALIDALQGGFSKITVVTAGTDEAGNPVETPVDFDAASIADVEVKDVEECDCDSQEDDSAEGDDPDVDECGDCDEEIEESEDVEEDEDIEESEDVEEDKDVEECGDVEECDDADEDIEESEDVEECGDVEECDDADEDIEEDEEGDASKWLDDSGVCVKCGDPACKGDCKCPKCGSVDCIGDCE